MSEKTYHLNPFGNVQSRNPQKYYPLSHPQMRELITEKTYPGTGFANIPFTVRLKENVDFELLEQAINTALYKNDGLRFRLAQQEYEYKQYIEKFQPVKCDFFDFSSKFGKERYEKWITQQTAKPFEPDQSNLFYFALIQWEDGGGFFVNIHHVIADGGTMKQIIDEIVGYYRLLVRGVQPDSTKNPCYTEFIHTEATYLKSAQCTQDKKYWLETFDSMPLEIVLPWNKRKDYDIKASVRKFSFDPELCTLADSFQKENRTSFFRLVTASIFIYLSKILRTRDITAGILTHNRTTEEEGRMAGMFVNTFPFRRDVDTTMTFRDFILDFQEEFLDILKNHSRYPIDLMINDLRKKHGTIPNLLNIVIAGQNFSGEDSDVEHHHPGFEQPPYHLLVYVVKDADHGGSQLEFTFPEGMYDDRVIELLHGHISRILKAGLEHPDEQISRIDMLSENEKQTLLNDFNRTEKNYPSNTTIIEHFLEQVEKTPDTTALVFEDTTLSYRELNERANRIGHFLQNRGVRPDDIVGIMAEPSIDMISGILGILKSGAAYMPIDSAFPDQRIAYMLEDSGSRTVLTHSRLFEKCAGFTGDIFDFNNSALLRESVLEPEQTCGPADLAYIIYTSGSTGKPKGVMIEHRSLVNLCFDQKDLREIVPEDRCAKFAGFAFDASVFEIFPPLIAGAALYVVSSDLRMSPKNLGKYFDDEGINQAFLPTQFVEQFMELAENTSLDLVVTGGDKLRHFKKMPYRLINEYGPTEYTVCSSAFEVDTSYDNIPIGKPLSNTRAYILDSFGMPVPCGVPGELCVSGRGLARGYLNKPEITQEKFVTNPFEPGALMYRTGDLTRWLPDGNLEFLGRIDFQVKVRGYRIELGEVEREILAEDHIDACVVIARGDADEDRHLCAFFTADTKIDIETIQKDLSRRLPSYMIPAFWMQLEKMPVNPNGKIDRKAMPEIERETGEIARPANLVEEGLLALFREILGLESISTTESFFNLGGHSLKANLLLVKIETTLGVQLSFKDIFTHPSIRELGTRIQSAQKKSGQTKSVQTKSVQTKSGQMPSAQAKSFSSIEPAPEMAGYPLTAAQKRLFITEQMEGIGTTYNIPLILKINGRLDKSKLIRAFTQIVQRQDSLRTFFEVSDAGPVQKIEENVKFRKDYLEVGKEEVSLIIQDFIRPFNLEEPPLFRLQLLKTGDTEHILMMDVHHSVFDGSSMVIFVKELADLYAGRALTPLPIRYRDFAWWQKSFLLSEAMQKQEAFWLKTFETLPPVLDMPADFPRPPVLRYEGARIASEIDAKLTGKLRTFAADNNVTLYMVMMAAFNILLARYSGQEDIVVGAGSAGRNKKEVENLIGMFVNTLPVRSYPEDTKTFTGFLGEVRETLLNVYDNQDFQFEDLVERLELKRDASRLPLFDVGFVFLSMGFPTVQLDDIEIVPQAFDHNIAHMDIMLEAVEGDEGLFLNWEYRTSLYRSETIERLAGHYTQILTVLMEAPDILLKDVPIVSEKEQHELIYRFNQTEAAFPAELTVNELFEQTAEKFPDRTAVVFEDQTMTYGQLNEKANQLARFLRDKGVGADTIVGIMLEKCPEMIVGMLGIIKAGGCYLPIKPDFPQDRIDYMLSNSEAPVLLTTGEYMDKAENYTGDVLDLNAPAIYEADTANLPVVNTPENLIYIIYTSGSTGRPKGVMLEHHNIVRLFTNSTMGTDGYYGFDEHDAWSMFHSFCFDFSVWEMYGALLYGGKLVMVSKKTAVNPVSFLELLKEEQVTVLSQTPGAFYNLIEEDLKSDDRDLCIRYVTFGGEELKPFLLADWHEKYPKTQLINMYGITETTVHVTYKEIEDDEIRNKISNIGVPIPTLTTYIMDRNLNLLPLGVPGELCVGGEGLARGYLGLPEVTADRFVENPWKKGERIYRSGDLARKLPGGDMEYMGRIDFQVKIRGFRIELGEIENQLLKHGFVRKAVVIARDDDQNGRYLAAYLVMEDGKDMTIAELREHILRELPDYMIPSYFIKLDTMPLTSNGKVDRKLLPEPSDHIETGTTFIDARNTREKKIAAVWAKVLGLDTVSVLDNFFELGGHSLKAVSVVAELQHDFEVAVNDIFEYQTVAGLAENIKVRGDSLKTRLGKLKQALMADVEQRDSARDEDLEKMAAYREHNKKYSTLDYSGRRTYSRVLLTGATGYLGIHILRELLTDREKKVYLIVRGKTREAAEQRVLEKLAYYFGSDFYTKFGSRITVFNGDLGEAYLGLSQKTYEELASKVDAVFHPAALVKHYGDYEVFYHSNVGATLQLLEFAATHTKKDFHHISTLSVSDGFVEGQDHIVFSEYDYDLGQKSDNYYARTKFEAERCVFEARKDGLNTTIYRVGNISINSKTGHLQQNIEENAFYIQTRAFINIGAVPSEEDEAEFAFVDSLSQAIVRLAETDCLENETFHLMNSNAVKLSEVLTFARLGLNIQPMSLPDFMDYLYLNYDHRGFKEHIESIMLHRGWLAKLDELTTKHTTCTLLADKTELVLENVGFKWPELEVKTLHDLVVKALGQRVAFLAALPMFGSLPPEALEQAAGLALQEYVKEGRDIVWEGEPNDSLYVIIDGHAEVSKHSQAGWLGTLGIAGTEDFFGEQNIWDSSASPVIVEAVLGDMRVFSFKGEEVRNLMARYPVFAMNLTREVAGKVQNLQTLMVNMG